MRPKGFDYHRPQDVDEAIRLLAENGSSEVLAGGQSLVPLMNRRLIQPERLIDITNITDLSYIDKTKTGDITIGALTTYSAIEDSDLITEESPLLQDVVSEIGDPIVRNRGTLGGNLAHAAPNADYPPNVVALDAKLKIVSETGTRTISASEFFKGDGETDLKKSELLTEVQIPQQPPNTNSAYMKITRRKNDPPLAAIASVVTTNATGICEKANIILGAVETKPIRARAAEVLLESEPIDEALIEDAAEKALEAPENPRDDVHASAEYRVKVVEPLTKKALKQTVIQDHNTNE